MTALPGARPARAYQLIDGPGPLAADILRFEGGDTFQAANAAKTECVNGHALTGDNLVLRPRGWRRCRTCYRASQNASAKRRRAA